MLFDYNSWRSGEPYNWMGCDRTSEWDQTDFHLDLGCGKIKKGRIGIDHFAAPGVNIVMDLNALVVKEICSAPNLDADTPDGYNKQVHGMAKWIQRYPTGKLPFPDSSIKSIVSHHAFEHIGDGFINLMDEIYRVLEPGGILRAITPLFPSRTAVEDADHKRYFMEGTWENFCGFPPDPEFHPGPEGNHWMSSFSVPYSKARFECVDRVCTPAVPIEQQWGDNDAREMRVALRARK